MRPTASAEFDPSVHSSPYHLEVVAGENAQKLPLPLCTAEAPGGSAAKAFCMVTSSYAHPSAVPSPEVTPQIKRRRCPQLSKGAARIPVGTRTSYMLSFACRRQTLRATPHLPVWLGTLVTGAQCESFYIVHRVKLSLLAHLEVPAPTMEHTLKCARLERHALPRSRWSTLVISLFTSSTADEVA